MVPKAVSKMQFLVLSLYCLSQSYLCLVLVLFVPVLTLFCPCRVPVLWSWFCSWRSCNFFFTPAFFFVCTVQFVSCFVFILFVSVLPLFCRSLLCPCPGSCCCLLLLLLLFGVVVGVAFIVMTVERMHLL